jgi:hypothetical protein
LTVLDFFTVGDEVFLVLGMLSPFPCGFHFTSGRKPSPYNSSRGYSKVSMHRIEETHPPRQDSEKV